MKRIFGLDLIRAIAILSVLLCHTMFLLYPFTSGYSELLFNLVSWATGFYGVEIFFVLSGFLIGNIFIKKVVLDNSQKNGIVVIGDFWMRRWIRTLPNYFLFLLLNFLLIPIVPNTELGFSTLLRYLVFVQTVLPNTTAFFGVSWSLAVEEWFYLLLPILFVFGFYLFKKKTTSLLLAMLLLLIIPTLLKIHFASQRPLHSDFESVFHYNTFFKLDSIFYGLLIAWMWNKENYKVWLIRNKKLLLFSGLFLILVSFIYAFLFVVKPIQNSILIILFAPLTSFAIALFFPFLHEWKIKENRISKAITFISLISYSLYLVHVPLINVYKFFWRTYALPTDVISSVFSLLILQILSVILANFIYRKFEMPILSMREQIGNRLFRKGKES